MPLLIIGLAAGVAGAGLSMYQSSQRNKAVGESMDAANRVTAEELAQQRRITEHNRKKNWIEQDKILGMVQVSAAARGVGPGGSAAALERNVTQSSAINDYAIGLDAYGASRRSLGQLAATQSQFAAQSSNMFLSGLTGAMQGFSTGISIGSGLKDMGIFSGSSGVGTMGASEAANFNNASFGYDTPSIYPAYLPTP